MSDEIGPADGLSHTMYQHLVKTLGEPYALAPGQRRAARHRISLAARRQPRSSRSAKPRASRSSSPSGRCRTRSSRRAGRRSKRSRGGCRTVCSSAGSAPSSTCRRSTSPGRKASSATSTARIIQPGDVIMIDWGVQLMNFGTDVKRVAYVLKPGETVPPKSIQARVRQSAVRARRAEEGDQAGRPRRTTR